MASRQGRAYRFGEFRLDAENPSLWLDDRLVPLPPKALEMLILLVIRHTRAEEEAGKAIFPPLTLIGIEPVASATGSAAPPPAPAASWIR